MTLNVLIVDDSPTVRQMLSQIVSNTPDLKVVGEACDGQQAVTFARNLRPDVILMDLMMPGMNGLEATREIMHFVPTPIVVVSSSLDNKETGIAFQAIRVGALAAIRKPAGPRDPDHQAQVRNLLTTLRAMAGVRVIHHWQTPAQSTVPAKTTQVDDMNAVVPPKIVAVVASTGGPAALSEIIEQLPGDFSLPIVIVQHITPDFMPSLETWMSGVTRLKVSLAQWGETPLPGRIYFAPGNAHLRLTARLRFDLDSVQGTALHMPSGDILLESVARSYGSQAVGVVLTGMGHDGARGLRAMRDAGAYTIAQDEATSVVYGMPQQAVAVGAARQVLPLQDIAKTLVKLSGTGDKTHGNTSPRVGDRR